MRSGFNRDVEHASVTLREAFNVLVGPESSNHPEVDHIMIKMLQCVHQMIIDGHHHMEHKFTVFEVCETALQDSQLSAQRIIRKIRLDLARVWEQECEVQAANKEYAG